MSSLRSPTPGQQGLGAKGKTSGDPQANPRQCLPGFPPPLFAGLLQADSEGPAGSGALKTGGANCDDDVTGKRFLEEESAFGYGFVAKF